MDRTVLFPSPQWFKESGLVVSNDGWIIYGGPSKSLCVLEPLPPNNENGDQEQRYKTLMMPRIQGEKIVCVDITPEWPTKHTIITGSADGSVKQWDLVDHKDFTAKATHSHDIHKRENEEVAGVAYYTATSAVTVSCYGCIVRWAFDSNVVKPYTVIKGFKPTCLKASPHVSGHIAVGTKQGIILVIDVNDGCKILCKVRAHDDEIYTLNWCPKYEVHVKKALKISASSRLAKIRTADEKKPTSEEATNPDVEAKETNDSQVCSSEGDEIEVPEDDMFDIYKDHEPDEFGHKKYQPEEILVKVDSEEKKETDYLSECMKLKDDIIKMKKEGERSIESLVDAMDKAQLNENVTGKSQDKATNDKEGTGDDVQAKGSVEDDSTASIHIHRHLLASVGKQGNVKVWSKSGKLVSNCVIHKAKPGIVNCVTLLWYKVDTLLLADGRGVLLECNPTYIDYKNTLEWKPVHHIHARGLYCIQSGAPKKQEIEDETDWPVWTVGQDRRLVQYSLKEKKAIAVHTTCGGFIYHIAACPYDASKIAVSVGDGAVRVWHGSDAAEEPLPFSGGEIVSYWQNVMGKVLTVAWHPTHENLLAFGTGESRLGVIHTSGNVERPARVLPPVIGTGIYALSWAPGKLYACGSGQLVYYQPSKPHLEGQVVPVTVEGREWRISFVVWSERALTVGSAEGAAAVLRPSLPHEHCSHAFPFTKMIHHMEWHPQQVSTSNEESIHKNLLAVCSAETNIVILEFTEEEDKSSLCVWKTLTGHENAVNHVAWSPHHEARLLSASSDNTYRVWDVTEGVCLSIYITRGSTGLTGIWSPNPSQAHCVLTGGTDSCVRLWDHRAYPYHPDLAKVAEKKKRKSKVVVRKKNADSKDEANQDAEVSEDDTTVANPQLRKIRVSKRFLLPIMYNQLLSEDIEGCQRLFQMHLSKIRNEVSNGAVLPEKDETNEQSTETDQNGENTYYKCDFIKIFGSTNDVNELLDLEMARHETAGFLEARVMLSLVRGDVAGAVALAAQHDALCPFLLSLVPSVSFKFWKDTQQLHIAQMERLVARREDEKVRALDWWACGGVIMRLAVTLLSMHDVGGAVALLQAHGLHKEAYALCRARHVHSLAGDVLRRWADHERLSQHYNASAACYLALGDVAEAAAVLAKSKVEAHLQLAGEMARFAGQKTYAAHIEHKGEQIRIERESNLDNQLQSLPTRAELLATDIEKSLNLGSEQT